MPVVGTAGHVDHGKSTLIRRLTGRDPDRWEEERERGLTIDLGFAWLRLEDDREISFVDVPGHDRFIKNMLAGIEAIDVALFVVSADEGWMPQSEEHLAVLDLLGVDRGIVALTKIDRADPELLELAALEVQERLDGTALSESPVVGVSSLTGEGIEELIAELSRLLPDAPDTTGSGPLLWIDRSFSVAGAGTVVTGTLANAPLSVGDAIEVLPEGIRGRVRGLQSHERDIDVAEPGRRVAVNLTGIDREQVDRGQLLATPDVRSLTARVAATFRTARYVDELTDRGAYHLHIGSGAWPVRIRLVSDRVVMMDLPTPLPLSMGDRWILRDSGRRLVVAGGRVLDPDPPRPRRLDDETVDRLTAVLEASPDERATALLEVRGRDSLDRLATHTDGGRPTGAVEAGGTAIAGHTAERLREELGAMVDTFHAEHPLRPGIGTAEAADRLGVPAPLVEGIADRRPGLKVEAGMITAAGFSVELDSDQEQEVDRIIDALSAAGMAALPRVSDLGIDQALLHAAVRRGTFVQVSPDFVFLPEQVDDLLAVMRRLDQPFGVSEFRDASGLTRKYAVPFLEWTDDVGRTVRMGDTRRLRD